MLHQPVADFDRNAEKLILGAREGVKPADRQRGMWSFLTWSFFLAQALAANEVFAKGAAAADNAQDTAEHATDSAVDAAAKAALANSFGGVSGDDAAAAAAAQFAAAVAAGLITPAMWAAIGDNPVLFKALLDTLAADHAAAGGIIEASAATAGEGDPVVGEPPSSDHGTDGVIPSIPDLPIQVIVDLELDLGGHVIDAVDNIITGVAQTVIGTVDTVVAAASDLLTSLDSVVSSATGLVTGTVDAATAALTGLVDGTVDALASTVGTSPVVRSRPWPWPLTISSAAPSAPLETSRPGW